MRIAAHGEAAIDDAEDEPALVRHRRELDVQLHEQIGDRKVEGLGANGAGIVGGDVEQPVQHVLGRA